MAIQLQLRHGTTAENDLFTGALSEPSYDTERKELRIHDGSTVGGKIITVPTGAIMSFGGSVAPKGWLLCDGSEVSRSDYADLFDVIGTNYGNGDGSTTFNLPNFKIQTATVANVITNGQQPIFTDGSQNGSLQQAMKNLSGYTYYMYADGVGLPEWGSTALKFGSQSGLKVDMTSTAIMAIIKY